MYEFNFMKVITLVSACIILLSFSCRKVKESNVKDKDANVVNSIDYPLEIYNFEHFKPFLNRLDDKIYVINFWATWCAPCVKELPYFEALHAKYGNRNVEVILVSLDFPHLYESKLKPFIIKNQIKSRVIALDGVDANNWIFEVDENWTGSIPATLIYKNNNARFYEQSFSYEELENEIKSLIN